VVRKGLLHYTWDYIHINPEVDLERNGQALLDAVLPNEKRSINEYWVPKERRLVAYYTYQLKNLGQTAPQRVERYHRVIKSVTHGQHSLEGSAKALCAKISSIHIELTTSEDRATTDQSRALDAYVFRHLVGTVSLFAIMMVQKEWIEMSTKMLAAEELRECYCDILNRYSLPCRHYLRPIWETETSTPRSFLHPRWWL
jgi:hypothetical protein